jgi:hypothetical protein
MKRIFELGYITSVVHEHTNLQFLGALCMAGEELGEAHQFTRPHHLIRQQYIAHTTIQQGFKLRHLAELVLSTVVYEKYTAETVFESCGYRLRAAPSC